MTVKGFTKSADLIGSSGQQMEEGNDCPLKLCSSTCWQPQHFSTGESQREDLPVLIVAGLNDFHTIVSQMLVAMKREMPEPRPYPFWSSSSNSRTTRPAHSSCGG